MGYKNDDPCLKKALEQERLFVLMTRDAHAPMAVLEWIKLSFNEQPDEKLREAFECALEMKNRREEIIEAKKPRCEHGEFGFCIQCAEDETLMRAGNRF